MGPGHPSPGDEGATEPETGHSLADPYLRWLEQQFREGKADLRGRVRELDCLFTVDRALRRPDREWRVSLREVAEALPHAFRSPRLMGARIRVGEEEFVTEGYERTRWVLTRAIACGVEELGEVEVCFLTHPPADETAPFTPDEERILAGVADRLGEALGRIQAEGEVRQGEAFLRALIRASPVALFSLDGHGTVLNWNPAAERVFGWLADEVVGTPLPIVSADQEEEFAEMRERAAQGESLSGMQFVSRRQDGTRVDIILSFSPVQDQAGQVVGIMYAVEDFTDQEGAWRQTRFQSRLLEAVGQAVVATGLGGKISYWNRAAETLYGWSSREALGLDITEVTLSERARGEAAGQMELMRRGESWMGELQGLRRDGSIFSGLVTASPILDEKGRLVGTIRVSSDIGKIKDLEAQLFQSQKMEALGRLAGGVAHDFNNLLTVIQGYVEMALEELPPGSKLRDDMHEILHATRRATELTRPLLALSRHQTADVAVMDLRKALAAMEPLLRRLIPSRIETELDAGGGPAFVRADPSQVGQVILNLAVNAADAVDGTGRITFGVDQYEVPPEEAGSPPWGGPPGVYARLTVADSGCGISPAVRERIFDPFFTTKPVGEGSGLGLSMVFGIVGRGGGHIRLDSEVDVGSTFEVSWPMVEPPPDADGEAVRLEVGRDASDDGTGRAEGQGVLLVDDAPGVRSMAQRALERAGYRVFMAADGQEALTLVERHRGEIQLVVSDVVMPVMGGEDLLDCLKETSPDLQVVLMSGYSEREVTGDLRSRASGFLDKPFGPNELIRMVRETIAR